MKEATWCTQAFCEAKRLNRCLLCSFSILLLGQRTCCFSRMLQALCLANLALCRCISAISIITRISWPPKAFRHCLLLRCYMLLPSLSIRMDMRCLHQKSAKSMPAWAIHRNISKPPVQTETQKAGIAGIKKKKCRHLNSSKCFVNSGLIPLIAAHVGTLMTSHDHPSFWSLNVCHESKSTQTYEAGGCIWCYLRCACDAACS